MLPEGPVTDKIGFALSRVVVPLWVLTGAGFKMWEGSPINLPQNFVAFGRSVGWIDLNTMLYTLIGLEFFAILVMVLLARFARPMAIFMLSVFCLVLIGEMVRGEEACGCFGGGVEIKPWQMLVIDGALLLGVIAFRSPVPEKSFGWQQALPIAGGLVVVGLAVSFAGAAILHGDRLQEAEIVEGDESDPTINPSPRSLPSWWYPENLDAWVGKPWREIELFQFMRRWPAGMDEGKVYVVVYSRTCGHCREMFEQDLVVPLDSPVIAIKIPHSRTRLTSPDPLFDPTVADPGVQHLALPLGTDWNMITSPVAMRIEDGIVTCAQEGNHRECMELPIFDD